jgi:ABC-2 type transport system permease protein
MEKIIARYRYSAILLKQLVKTDFKLRYQGSVLGYAWSLLRPLFLFVILYIVFAKFLKVGEGIPHFPVYLLLGIVLWNYFVEITTGSVAAVVSKGDLIRKINFPKYVIVLSGCASALINLVLNFIVIGFFMALTGVDIGLSALYAIPLLIELTVFALGLAFLLSAAYVRFRDVGYIWEVAVQGAFYATPILYPLTLVPLVAQKILILNPVAQIIQDVRHVLVTPHTVIMSDIYSSWLMWIVPIVIVCVTALASALYFRSRSRYFAEGV